ncbi:MAG: hypothetical protein V3S24_15910 [Candidatus Tectomicrobia bacterium]
MNPNTVADRPANMDAEGKPIMPEAFVDLRIMLHLLTRVTP